MSTPRFLGLPGPTTPFPTADPVGIEFIPMDNDQEARLERRAARAFLLGGLCGIALGSLAAIVIVARFAL